MSKRYNTPHRDHIIKTRMTEEEYNDFIERLAAYDLSQAKRAEGKGVGFTRWASGFNLKQMAASLNMYTENKFSSLEEVDELVSAAQKELRESLAKGKAIESVIEEKKELRTQLLNYWQAKTVRQEYKAMKPGKKRDVYYREHESELLLSKAAEKFFKDHGIPSPLPKRKNLQAEIERFISEKNVLYEDYRDKKKRTDELLNTLIEKIVVHEAIKDKAGTREQEVEIFYRFVGKID